MPDEEPLISPRPPKGLRRATRLARVIMALDGMRVHYQVWAAALQRPLMGHGRLHVQMVEDTLGCRVLGEVFLPTGYEFCFHSFWLTRRGMVMLVKDTASAAGTEEEAMTRDGSFIRPVEWSDSATAAARAWVNKSN